MQSLITKRLFKNTYRLGSRAVQSNLKHIALTQSLAQQAASSIGLTSSFHRTFSEQVQFDKVTSYESLISRISFATNVNDLLNITHQNIALFKNEHVVLSLRVLARLLRTTNPNPNQVDSLQKDDRYLELTKKAQENLEEFNEYEILDFLFWLRRFKLARIPSNISDESLNKLYSKVREFVKSKSFNFRNLVNLFYDLSCLNKNTDDIASEILNELKADNKLLTPFTVVQILQACARKGGAASSRELSVADYVQRNLTPMLAEFDSDQKCLVFRYLSNLEMHLNAPKYRTPPTLIALKTQLKEILDQLSEIGVINILEAYVELPKEVSPDLLDEIKEMVIVTIQHNSENIKSFFLVDFLDRSTSLPRFRRIHNDKISIMYEEITKRLPNDEYIGRIRSIEKLVGIYQKAGVNYAPLVDAIYQKIADLQGPFFSSTIYQFLAKNGKDVSPLLDTFIESGNVEKLGFFQRLQLYLVLSTLDLSKYQNLEKEIKASLLSNPADTYKLIHTLTDLDLKDSSAEEVQLAAAESLKNARERLNDYAFYRNIFQSVTNRVTRNYWTEYLKTDLAQADAKKLSVFTDAFLSLNNITTERILLFARLIEEAAHENVPFRKICFALKDNKKFVNEFSKFEPRLSKFLSKFLQWLETHKEAARLQTIFGVVKRLNDSGVRSPVIAQIAKKALELSKDSSYPPSPQMELIYGLYLIENGVLKTEDARVIYERIKDVPNVEKFTKVKVFSYLLQKSDPSILEKEETVNEINEKLELLQKNLSETGARTVLSALALSLTFPPQFLEPNKELYVKAAKSFISFGNAQLYLNLINSIPPQYVRKNYEFYLPIIRELITNYNSFNKRMNGSDINTVITKFSSFNTRNPTIYNYILYDIGRVFNNLRSDELVNVVNAFSKVHIKQTDLFDKILVKVGNNPGNFARNFRNLVQSLYAVGFNSQQAKITIPEVFNKLRISHSATVLFYLSYIPILNLENEAEIIETLIPKVTGNPNFPKRTGVLLYEYLRVAYRNKPELAEVVKPIISDFDSTYRSTFEHSNSLLKARNLIGEYLKVMKVDFETNHSIDGHNVDIFIPQNKSTVKIFLNPDVNFDKFSLTGRGLLHKKIYQSLQDSNPIFINLSEFLSTPEQINKVNYLAATGIPNNNTEGVYDFSQIQGTPSEREEHSAEEGEKEDDVELSDVSEIQEAIEEELAELDEEGDKRKH